MALSCCPILSKDGFSFKMLAWKLPSAIWCWQLHDGPELLPDFVQGWFLLQDAGLETAERNLVLAALKNDFSVLRVAQELRNQWGDEDLRRRDMSQRGAAWVVSEQPSDGEATGDWDSPDYAQLVESGLNAEGLAVMESAEDA
eukprot:s1320_g22.t1